MIPLRDDNPTILTPIITVALISTCVLIFIWQAPLGQAGFEKILFRPAVAAGELASIVGSGFLVYISIAQFGTGDGGTGECGLFRPRQRFYRRRGIDPLL